MLPISKALRCQIGKLLALLIQTLNGMDSSPTWGAEKGQKQASSWKRPRLYLPVRRLALPVGTGGGPGGGWREGGATQPEWRLPPRESLGAQGQHQSTAHFRCGRRPGATSQEFSVTEFYRRTSYSVISNVTQTEKTSCELITIMLCCISIILN